MAKITYSWPTTSHCQFRLAAFQRFLDRVLVRDLIIENVFNWISHIANLEIVRIQCYTIFTIQEIIYFYFLFFLKCATIRACQENQCLQYGVVQFISTVQKKTLVGGFPSYIINIFSKKLYIVINGRGPFVGEVMEQSRLERFTNVKGPFLGLKNLIGNLLDLYISLVKFNFYMILHFR